MRKPITFKLDVDVLGRARQAAIADGRTLTAFVEAAVTEALNGASDSPKPSSLPRCGIG